MKKTFVAVLALALMACFSQKQAETPADWTKAWDADNGKCVKSAGSEAYTACLEKRLQIQAEHPRPAVQETFTETRERRVTVIEGNDPTEIRRSPEEIAADSAAAPPSPPAPLQQMQVQGRTVWVPVATGPYCSVQDALTLEVRNNSDYLVEVSGKVVPLNCEQGDKWMPARVLRRNGMLEDTWVIPQHTTARLVFLPLDGGLGRVGVRFEAYLNLGPMAPAPAVGFLKRDFQVPYQNRGLPPNHHWQDVSSGRLTMFR